MSQETSNAKIRKFKDPVAWLAGRDLLANLNYFVLFAAFKGKLDPRDWMQEEVFPPRGKATEPVKDEEQTEESKTDPFWRPYLNRWEDADAFWFDYMADTGDGMRAGYSLAYVCMQDLRLFSRPGEAQKVEISSRPLKGEGGTQVTLPRGAFLFIGGDTTYHVADYASLADRFQAPFRWAFEDLKTDGVFSQQEMTADGQNLIEQRLRPLFGLPGNHDYYDMVDGFNRQFQHPLTDENGALHHGGRKMPPLLSIPTFKRYQRATYVALKLPFDWWFWGVDSELDRLDIRQQEFFRNAYKQSLPEEERAQLGDQQPLPRKLIVATSEPTTVTGRRARPDDKTARAFFDLGLKRPFMYRGLDQNSLPAELRDEAKKEQGFDDFDCRLDISGDTHHYARYWGKDTQGWGEEWGHTHYASVVSGGGGATMYSTDTDLREVRAQSLYPSKTDSRASIFTRLLNPWRIMRGGNVYLIGTIISLVVYFEAAIFPAHREAVNTILGRLLHVPFLTARGLDLGFFSAGQALGHAFAYLQPPSPLIHFLKLASLLLFVSLGAIVGAIKYADWLFQRLTMSYDWAFDSYHRTDEESSAQESSTSAERRQYEELLDGIKGQRSMGHALKNHGFLWLLSAMGLLLNLTIWALVYVAWKRELLPSASYYRWGVGLYLVASLAYIGLCLKYSGSRLKRLRDVVKNERGPSAVVEVRDLIVTPWHDYVPFWALLLLSASSLWLVVCDYWLSPLSRFSSSLLTFLSILIAGTALLCGTYYSKWLFKQSYRIAVTFFSYWPVRALYVLSIVSLGAALSTFGLFETRSMSADLVFIFVVSVISLGCIGLAVFVGGSLYSGLRKLRFSLLGVWHAVLQLLVPFLLVWVGNWKAWVIAALTALIMTLLRGSLVRQVIIPCGDRQDRQARLHPERKRWNIAGPVLAFIWVCYGIWILYLPALFHKGALPFARTFWQLFASGVLAGAFGCAMSCVWCGWYFAASMAFNGHNAEAGSAARVEGYKHFIRFRLTRDGLTGYVIGIDAPVERQSAEYNPRSPTAPEESLDETGDSKPRCRLIEVFELKAKGQG